MVAPAAKTLPNSVRPRVARRRRCGAWWQRRMRGRCGWSSRAGGRGNGEQRASLEPSDRTPHESCVAIGDNAVCCQPLHPTPPGLTTPDNVRTSPPSTRSRIDCWAGPASSALQADSRTAQCLTWMAFAHASNAALPKNPEQHCNIWRRRGFNPLRGQLAASRGQQGRQGCRGRQPHRHHQPAGAGPAGQTLISPGDKVIVEGPTFLATIQCFRLYGAELISAPSVATAWRPTSWKKLIAGTQTEIRLPGPHLPGNPSAMLEPGAPE